MLRLLVGVGFVLSLNFSPTLAEASSLQLRPMSLSFPSAHLGYVLSLYDCAKRTCAALRSTANEASSWNVVPTPNQLNNDLQLISWGKYGAEYSYSTINVHFANAKDGWIYGSVPVPSAHNKTNPNWVNRLWSTLDGGKTWRQIRLGPLSITAGVFQMATHGAWSYLFGGSYDNGRAYVLATRSNDDQWTSDSKQPMYMPAGGTQLEGAFSFVGSKGWFVAGNDRGFTASAQLANDASWRAWSGPSFEHFGASFSPIAAVTGNILIALGQSAGFVIPPASSVPPNWNNSASWLFISYDAGATFKPFRELSSSYQRGYYAESGLPAAPVPGTILLQRFTNSGGQMVRSTNWGRTWQVVLNNSVSQVEFISRSTGFAIVQRGTTLTDSSLVQSGDAGSHWREVSIGARR
jgi:hypothetical protein